MQAIGGRGFEAVPEVEAPCVVIDRVHQQGAHADRAGGGQCPQHGVTQQPRAKPAARDCEVHGEPDEQYDGNRVPRQAFRDARGRCVTFDTGGGQRVITNDSLLIGVDDHVRASRPATSGLARVASQPNVQR